MTFRAYLFDLDGTLIDSIALILDSFHHTRERHFGDRMPDAYYLETVGMPLRDAFAKMGSLPDAVEALVSTYRDYNLAHHDAMVRAYDGVVPMIRSLSERGARLAVVTSKVTTTALRGLAVMGIADAFELIVSADDVVRGKPDPEPVLLALSKLGVTANETVFVGDSPHDIQAGNRALVKTAAATWGPFPRSALEAAKPSFYVNTPADVLAL